VTNLDLCNDENRPSSTSSAVAETRQVCIIEKHAEMKWLTLSLEATISVSGPSGQPMYWKKAGILVEV